MKTHGKLRRVCFLLAVALLFGYVVETACAGSPSPRELPQQPAEFSAIAERLAAQRLAGAEEDQALQDRALALLDAIALAGLNGPGEPALEVLNQHLAGLVTSQPGAGESFRVLKLAGRPPAYVLAANFGLAGPSAVRVYAGAPGRYVLAARIDRYAQRDFFDEYLELLCVAGPSAAAPSLFVTVTGRTDDLQTGSFAAWSFDGSRLRAVWSSDLLQQSSYEAGTDGFRVTYCAETDEDNPRLCRRMTRDRYVWNATDWKRVEQTPVPVPKR
jgi:hypothetical protein